MGTSNWQNIPFCVEALMKIAPQRVLDVGVGYGRWGMIVREFCDVWYGRVFKKQWTVDIQGIEAFQENIVDYHSSFYNHIFVGDALQIIPRLETNWNVVIFGDVLEHFERDEAEKLLNWCLVHSDYILVNIPLGTEWPQIEMYSNPYEKHKSVWIESDFDKFWNCRKAIFSDYIDRPFGSFILSKFDPKDLSTSLFSRNSLRAVPQLSASLSTFDNAMQIRNKQLVEELEFIKNSRGYLLLERLKASPLAGILIKFARWSMPGYIPPPPKSIASEPISSFERNGNSQSGSSLPETSPVVSGVPEIIERSAVDEKWVIEQRQNPLPLSINHPEWRGILASSTELFGNVYKIPDNLDELKARYYADLLHEASPPSITIQGFPLTYYHLVNAMRRIAPQIPIFVIWHGNFLHTQEDYAWESFKLVKTLLDEGDIKKIGFVKIGMAEVINKLGIESQFIMNLVRKIPDHASKPYQNGTHIGIWATPDWSWKKLPYAMIASLELIPDCLGHVHNVSPRAQEFGQLFNLKAEYITDSLTRAEVLKKMSSMHVNINISLTECAPMLPLESLSVGVPCLFGPTSHYFLDADYLHSRLVVPYPDNAEIIAKYTIQALEERTAIIDAYRNYAPENNKRALERLSNFLGFQMMNT